MAPTSLPRQEQKNNNTRTDSDTCTSRIHARGHHTGNVIRSTPVFGSPYFRLPSHRSFQLIFATFAFFSVLGGTCELLTYICWRVSSTLREVNLYYRLRYLLATLMPSRSGRAHVRFRTEVAGALRPEVQRGRTSPRQLLPRTPA